MNKSIKQRIGMACCTVGLIGGLAADTRADDPLVKYGSDATTSPAMREVADPAGSALGMPYVYREWEQFKKKEIFRLVKLYLSIEVEKKFPSLHRVPLYMMSTGISME